MEFYIIIILLYLIGMYTFSIMCGDDFTDYPEWLQAWITVFWFVPAISVWVWNFGQVVWTIPLMIIYQAKRFKK